MGQTVLYLAGVIIVTDIVAVAGLMISDWRQRR